MIEKLFHEHNMLYYKAMYLKAKLEEVTVIFEQCNKEFLIEVTKNKRRPAVVSLAKASKYLTKSLNKISDDKKKTVSNDFKKIYRKIMLKTHPDKLIHLEDSLRGVYSKICTKAMTAMEEEDWLLLFGAAKELGIEDVEINDDHIKILKTRCKDTEAEICRIKRTIPWIWFHNNDDDEIKERCLKQFLKVYA